MNKYEETITWYDVKDVLPGFDDNFDNVVYHCLCQVRYKNANGEVDMDDDPGVVTLWYDKDNDEWTLPLGEPYNWGWFVVAWCKQPYGPFHRNFKGKEKIIL